MTFLPDDILKSPPFQAFLADMATLGVTPVAEGGRAYAVIAARSNARWWFLPLEDRRAAAAGLELMHPITRAAKAAKITARVVAQLGLCRFLGKGQMRLSCLPELTRAFGSEASHLAYFTGTDGPHRKTTVQVMKADGTILGYCKLSRKKHVRPYIRNEAEMLARVAALNLATADLPHVIALSDDADLTLLVTDSQKSADAMSPVQLGALHLRWLDELCTRTKRFGAATLLADLAGRIAAIKEVAGEEWANRISRSLDALHPVKTDIQLCFVHGDFTPWNSFTCGDRLYVFDWEYANPAWPVGFDFVHFMLSTIPPNRQLQQLPRVLEELASAQFARHKESAHRALLLSLVCHAVFYLGRLAEVQGALTDWRDGPVRATLIDRMLDAGGLDT